MQGDIVGLEETKEILFDGLSRLADFCEAHDITYYLAFGTLLGAVRSGDYIPWDDDVDVMILRKDYDRLLSLSSMIEDDDWQLLSYKKIEGYYIPWMKFSHKHSVILPTRFSSGYVYGLSIDIFPVDCINSNNYNNAYEEAEQLNKTYKAAVKKYIPFGTLRTGTINSVKRYLKRIYFNTYQQIYGSIKTNCYERMETDLRRVEVRRDIYCCNVFARVVAVFPVKDFIGENKKMLFHGRSFSIPHGYHEILTLRYGANYIEPPPKEKQVSEHIYTAYRL